MSTDTRPGKGNGAGARRTIGRRVSVHLTLPPQLAERLRDAAERLGVSRSLIAREAVVRGLKPATDAVRAKLRRERDANSGANAAADPAGGVGEAGK